MVQHWKKDSSGGQIVWQKETVGASNANNILVTNPDVTSVPDNLNSVLGKMKGNINELYGNVKWLALHGGGGAGGGGGTEGGETNTNPYLVFVQITNAGETPLDNNGTLSVSSDEVTIGVYLYNAVADRKYSISVSTPSNVYVNNKELTRLNNYTEFKVSNIGILENLKLTGTMRDDEGVRFPSVYLNINYASVTVDAYLVQDNTKIEKGSSVVSKEINTDFEVDFEFSTSIIGGQISYTITAPSLYNDSGKSFIQTGTVENGDGISVNFSDEYNFQISRSYEIKVAAKVVTYVDGHIITLASTLFLFNAQKLNEDDLFVTFSDKRWKLLENSFDENLWENGQDAILDSVLVGNKNYYGDIYYVAKFYYEKGRGATDTYWQEISPSLLQGYGYFEDDDETTPDFLTEAAKESYKDVVSGEDKKEWLRKYSVMLDNWKNANKLRNFSITNNYGTTANVTVSYPLISTLSDLFNFNEVETRDEENDIVIKTDKFQSNGGGAIAHIRVDLYAFNLNGDDADHIIIPLQNVDGEIKYVPTVSVKTRIRKSAMSVPTYARGVMHGVVKSATETDYIETESLVFDFDSINSGRAVIQSTLNTLTDAKYVSEQYIGSTKVSIPMYMVNCNGDKDGKGNSGIVKIKKYSELNNKRLKFIDGKDIENEYKAFRVSGNSYGLINYDSAFKRVLDFSKASTKTQGFTISLVFQSDWHSHNKGTIFAMGDYSADGTLINGINVDLEKVSFVIRESVSNQNVAVSFNLIQGEFTQLDFVYEYSKVRSGASDIEYGIIKIYQNGICTGIGNLAFPQNSDLVFSSLTNGITIGCKSTMKNGVLGSNFTDANIFGLRIYNESLTDCEIIKNWMISNSMANLGWELNDSGSYSSIVDFDNVVNPQMRRNFFFNIEKKQQWISSIWDYGTSKGQKTKVASGQELFERLSAWIQPEKGDGYRALPVVYLHNNGEICSQIGQSSDKFYDVYNESQASENNHYIDNKDFRNCFEGIFEFFDTTVENSVSSDVYMKGHRVAWYMQGTSTQSNRSKNIEVCFENDDTDPKATGDIGWEKEGVGLIKGEGEFLFTPKPSKWLPENRFTLKADVVDSGHANNAAIGGWINSSGFMPKNPVQQDTSYEYRDFVKPTLEGFPVLVFVNWGTKKNDDGTIDANFQKKNGIQFLGIYSFNLGRGSYFNLGFKKMHKYELAGNANKNIGDSEPDRWSDPRACKHASFVSRYLLEEDNPNIFSFESTTNEPVGAVGFEQPNISLLQDIWDIKYKSDGADKNIGYSRLKEVVKNIAYFNDDNLNYFGTSSIPEYYFATGELTAKKLPGKVDVLRNVEDFRDYRLGVVAPEGSASSTKDGETYYTFPNGKVYKADFLRWYEGLRDFENEDFSCNGRNTDIRTDGNYEIYDKDGNFLPCFYSQGNVNGNLIKDYFPDRTEGRDVYQKLGYYYSLEGGFVQSLDETPKIDEELYRTQWIHYPSFSRYFIIAMVFGMVDSLGKNLTLRSWNITDANHGTFVPAFYDMDTALGLDNGGNENVDPTVYMDYWLSQNTKEGAMDESSLHIFVEDIPYIRETEELYEFYDKPNGVCLARYRKDGVYPPLPQSTQYDLPKSQLWHVIRFMPELYKGLNDYNSGIGDGAAASVPAWAPLGQYTTLRSNFLYSINDFFENYYLKHTENVGEFIFNLDYTEKYQTPYQKPDSNSVTYGDMRLCHGRRTSFVKQWLTSRLVFLDSVMNLGHALKYCNANMKGGIEYLRNYESTGTADRFFFQDPKEKTLSSALSSTNPVYITATKNNLASTTNAIASSYNFVITTNESIMLMVSFTNMTYHCFIRKNVPTIFKITGFKANSNSLTFIAYATGVISEWENFKCLNVASFDSKAVGANWNLINFDLSPDESLGVLGNSLIKNDSLKLDSMTELRELNLSGISSSNDLYLDGINLSEMLKLQTLDISKSSIQNISFPSGGNLKTLKMDGCSMLVGELRLISLGSLEGTLDLTKCSKLTSVVIKNCPKLKNIIFSQNSSLTQIQIADCPSLESFNYAGEYTITNSEAVTTSLIEKISITGDCGGIKTCSISNINNDSLELDLSGLIGLQNLSLISLSTKNKPILPDYYNVNEDSLVRTTYPIYNVEQNVSISLNDIQFSGFLYGNNDRSLIGYRFTQNSDEYPEFYLGGDADIEPNEAVLNLATFPKIQNLTIVKCPKIRYVACNVANAVKNVNLLNDGALERMFGTYPIFYNTAVFGYKALNNYRVCDWNAGSAARSSKEVKEKFEEVMDNPEKMNEFIELMHDSYDGQTDVQGALPHSRFMMPQTKVISLENAFNTTQISMNDVYYIMLLVNLYNKENESILNLTKMFQGCEQIHSSYSETLDLSPSHYLFKYLYSVVNIQNVFGGCSNMGGVLYSPDYTIGDDGVLTDDKIGLLTPFVKNVSAFSNLGWALSMYDDYSFWTPKGTPTYYNSSILYDGTCDAITNVSGVLNSVYCITSAIYNNVDSTRSYFQSSKLLRPFHKASKIENSFNGISVDFSEGNQTNVWNGKYYTNSSLLKGMTNLTDISNSFNLRLAANTVIVDLFAGNPYSLANEPNEYPNSLRKIEGSFSFSCVGGFAYFALTDDMFQRVANTISIISPIVNKDEIYTITSDTNGTFSGTNIIKTYVKYNSEGTHPEAKFPYGVFRRCSMLTHAPAFFSDLDLKCYVDATNKNKVVDYNDFENPFTVPVNEGLAEYLLDIPIPDFYTSKPYTRVETMEGNVEHSETIRLFADTKNLINISAMFSRLKPVRMSTSTNKFIPGGFVLTSDSLLGLNKLVNVQYLFADNHYFRGFIPYSLLKTDDVGSETELMVSGSNNLNLAFKGMNGCSVPVTDFGQMRYNSNQNLIPKGNGGLKTLLQKLDGYLYIPDNDEYYDPYIVAKDEEGEIIYQDVEGVKFATFVKCDLSNFEHRQQKRYRRISVNELEWYQTYDANFDSLSLETEKVTLMSENKNISNMSYLFNKNDSAGYLPLRVSNDYDNYTNIYANPVAGDTDYYQRCILYKWNPYQADDFIHTSEGKYTNKNMFCQNKEYSPFKLVENVQRDVNLTCVYERKAKEQDVVFVNANYDPRLYKFNMNTNKVEFNKFVMDGRILAPADIVEIIDVGKRYIVPSDVTLASASGEIVEDFLHQHLPEKWLNKQMIEPNPTKRVPNQESGIFYATESGNEMNISDSMLRPIADNEIEQIIKIKDVQNYFCPSDIFNHLSPTNANIRYAFAKTSYHLPKVNTGRLQKFVYDKTDDFNVEMKNTLNECLANGNEKNIAALGYYLEGNPYTGLSGRVSPMLFDETNTFQSIEGLFCGNPQLSPFSYSSIKTNKEGNAVAVSGRLFDSDTFRPLNQLKSYYLLWANNIVPKQVNIDPSTFVHNSNLQYLDYMFAGTLWFSDKTDIQNFGTQIPNGMFEGLQYLKSARATFLSPINFVVNIDETANISFVGGITGGEPTIAGEMGELGTSGIGIGKYGVRWVPDDLFEDSKEALQMVSNMFLFDQQLENYPDIYEYSNFKSNVSTQWNAKMYHTAYYIGRNLNETDKKAFSQTGPWELRPVEQSKDNGNKVYYESASYSSQLN